MVEDFYREQRRRFGLLVDAEGEPEGGRWNFDTANRKPPKAGLQAPVPYRPREGTIDEEVRADIDALGLDLFGADDPLAAVRAAERAYQAGDAPLQSVEGFVRQV